MIKIILLLFCLVPPTLALAEKPAEMLFAPHEVDYTKNIVSVEAGSVLFFSGFGVTYERSFTKSLSVRNSFGYIVKSDFLDGTGNVHSFFPSASVNGVYVFGNEGLGLEFSAGATYSRNNSSVDEKNVVFPSAGMGIRYKPVKEGIFFRTGIDVSASWVGIGVGVGFTWRD
jgi:hypothetical protein